MLKKLIAVIVVAFMLLAFPALAFAQPVVPQWRPPSNCTNGQFLKFNTSTIKWECGTATAFSTLNVIPKGDGTGLASSSITDDGATVTTASSVTLATGADRLLIIGRDPITTTPANNGLRIFPFSDGNVYFDAKTGVAGGTLIYRTGYNTEPGDTRTWMSVNASNGEVSTYATTWLAKDTSGTSVQIGYSSGNMTAGQNNITLIPDAGGDAYFETKVGSSKNIYFTYGHGTQPAYTTVWMSLASASNGVTMPGNLNVGNSVTVGDSAGDEHTFNGQIFLQLANATDNGSPGIQFINNDDFLYDGDYINHYGFGAFSDSSVSGGTVPYVAGWAGIRFFTQGASTCYMSSGGLDCTGFSIGGTAMLSSTAMNGTAGYIPQFSGPSSIINSNMFRNGTGNVTIMPESNLASLVVGTVGTGATDNGIQILAFNNDYNYVDSKVGNGLATIFRTGHNTEGGGVRTWLTVTGSDGAATFGNNVTLGDASTDVTLINGYAGIGTAASSNAGLWVEGTSGRGYSLYTTHTRSAATTTGVVGSFYQTGTYNTTAGALEAIGVYAFVDATRSAGANNLQSTAGVFNAVNGQLNYAVRTLNGDNQFNEVSGTSVFYNTMSVLGNTTIGNQSTDLMTINGRVYHEDLPTGATATRFVHNVQAIGTYDTTAGALIAIATLGNATATRSAGSNTLTNVGLYGTASGAQVNYGLWVDNGDSLFDGGVAITGAATTANAQLTLGTDGTNGTIAQRGAAGSNLIFKTSTAGGVEQTVLTLGFGGGATFGGDVVMGNGVISDNNSDVTVSDGLLINYGTPSGLGSLAANTLLTLQQANGLANNMAFYSTGQKSINFYNTSASPDGQISYDNPARTLTIVTGGTVRMAIGSTGQVQIGTTSNTAHSSTLALEVGGNLQATIVRSETQLADHTRGFEIFEDFLTEPGYGITTTAVVVAVMDSWVTAGANGGVNVNMYGSDWNNRPGILALKTEPTGVGASIATAGIVKGDADSGVGAGWFAGGGATKVAGAVNVGALAPTSSNSFEMKVGLFDDFGTPTPDNGIFCREDISASANWQVCTYKAGTGTCTDTSPTIAVAANKWIRCEFTVNAGGTQVDFTVSNVTDATSGTANRTTNIPNTSSNTVGIGVDQWRNSSTGGGTVYADYLWMDQTFTTAR